MSTDPYTEPMTGDDFAATFGIRMTIVTGPTLTADREPFTRVQEGGA